MSRARFELGLVVLGAVLIGGGSVLLRLQLPILDLPFNLRDFQYSLGFMLFGLLVLAAWQTGGQTRKVSVFLAFATLVALGFPTETRLIGLATNVVFGLSVILLGAIYFEFSRGKPSIRPLLGLLWAVMLVMALYGEGYLFLAIQRTENLQLAIGMIALLGIFAGYSSMLLREWRRASPGGITGFD